MKIVGAGRGYVGLSNVALLTQNLMRAGIIVASQVFTRDLFGAN